MNSQKKFQPSKLTIVEVAAILANSPSQTDRQTPKVACWAGFPAKKDKIAAETVHYLPDETDPWDECACGSNFHIWNIIPHYNV